MLGYILEVVLINPNCAGRFLSSGVSIHLSVLRRVNRADVPY